MVDRLPVMIGPGAELAHQLMAAFLSRHGLLDCWDVVVTANLSSEVVGWVCAHLPSHALRVGMCHDYAGSPFGPWSHLEETVDRGELACEVAKVSVHSDAVDKRQEALDAHGSLRRVMRCLRRRWRWFWRRSAVVGPVTAAAAADSGLGNSGGEASRNLQTEIDRWHFLWC